MTKPSNKIPGNQQQNNIAIEIINISPKSGFVQVKNWNAFKNYQPNINSWAEVRVPGGHDVMMSFTNIAVEAFVNKCYFDLVILYLGNMSPSNLIWVACEVIQPDPNLYRTDRFFIRFVTDAFSIAPSRQKLYGFRLHFSFHDHSSLPKKLPDGSWNCSVPYWADFQLHFACNLQQECSEGRDEAACFYTNELCSPGSFRAGDTCFMVVNPKRNITWKEARNDCYNRGGRLASLTSPIVWAYVIRILRLRWIHFIFVGLEMTPFTLPDVYQNLFQWSDGTIAYIVLLRGFHDENGCSYLRADLATIYFSLQKRCDLPIWRIPSLCQIDDKEEDEEVYFAEAQISMNAITLQSWSLLLNLSVVTCTNSHVTHAFLACDDASACWAKIVFSRWSCSAPLTPLPPSFTCDNGAQRVPYTLVCDHRSDCNDKSDEDFCQFSACHLSDFRCGGKQCIPRAQVCDNKKQCINGLDEADCRHWRKVNFKSLRPPAIVNMDSTLYLHMTNIKTSGRCPITHFQCVKNGYCLPVFCRCNRVIDCPQKNDEMGCTDYECPGYYRCRASDVCLHPEHMCDGVFHCPQNDDELLCHLHCPADCTCHGWAFYCSRSFPASDYPELRFLDAKLTLMKPSGIQNNSKLIYLSLASCGLKNLNGLDLPNLRILDVRSNHLRFIKTSELDLVSNLKKLYLSGNPLMGELFVRDTSEYFTFVSLQVLDLGRVPLPELNTSILAILPNLHTLNFAYCGIQQIEERFTFLFRLQIIDLTGSDVTFFPKDLFSGLYNLQSIYADNFKLCCPDMLPERFNILNCHAPQDEISSCGDLLRSSFYRILLFLFIVSAVLGNIGSFVLRICFSPSKAHGFGVLVTFLSVSDFLMGIYLLIIGIADQIYQGTYWWNDIAWKKSITCKIAGFFSLIACEASAFIVCLITFDRFVVLRFPFSRYCFSKQSAHAACGVVWSIGFILAVVPLLPFTSHWDFYGQTGICIPLPITRQEFAGHNYSFGVMIILNFILFLLIAVGQISIYWAIIKNSMSSSSSTRASKDLTIARRLITIAVTDFLCWFPISLLGLLASNGVPISGEVNVALAVVALPLNSAINPFLYTLNTVLERRRRVKEEHMQKLLSSQTSSVQSR